MNKKRVFLMLSVVVALVGCAPSIFGVSQGKWDQLTPEQQQKTMLEYYRREALGLKAYEENVAPSSVANIQTSNADTLDFTVDKPKPFMQRFRKDRISLKSHQHQQALAHERKQQTPPPPRSTVAKKPFFSRYSKDTMSLSSHGHKQALAAERQQTSTTAKKTTVKKADVKKTSVKKASSKKKVVKKNHVKKHTKEHTAKKTSLQKTKAVEDKKIKK